LREAAGRIHRSAIGCKPNARSWNSFFKIASKAAGIVRARDEFPRSARNLDQGSTGKDICMAVFPEKIADDRYSAKRNTRPINFFLAATEARSVHVIGDFNDWDPASHPMERQVDGTWLLQVFLTHGHHHYQFLVDGKPTTDPHAMGAVDIERHKRVSLIAVS
jgi:hypothetical protein